ncbi:PTS system trehalose-specific EIIBC component [Vagococcus bubulae]|uniref:PTS system trehalose-specific EIIBC component n=1 Tax=Vagococcus bubulae TaxID=1977868 RepID=UPI0022E201C8|nr:PTS system trehalose-specific EIIBC component [Vagococcus bubulae]
MGKFNQDALLLLDYVGGKENIAAVTHCATRMRFVLNDPSKAQEDKIEDISCVRGIFTNAGQFQVIIGNEVPTFYQEFMSISGIQGGTKEEIKSAAKQNQNMLQRAVTVLAEIFTPLLPAIIVGGLILGFRNILEAVPMGFLDGKTITESSTFWNGVNGFLWLPGEAIFHFLPVGITWSIAKKMKGTEILGIVLGITLVSPQLLNAYAVNSTSAADIAANWSWDFGFFTMDKIGYQAQVIPAMLAGFMLVYLERFLRKHIPEAISMIFVPFFALLPTILAAHLILGPIGWKIGSAISTVVNTGLTSSLNWLFAAVFGTFYAPLVITGLHHTTLAIDQQLVADFGSTNLWPMICLSNIAQGAAVLAVVYAHRGNKKEEQVSVPSVISAWLGVTEPAMFGINLKYMYPFVAAMIGSGIAGLFVTLFGVRALSIGVGGLPGILAIVPKYYGVFFIGMIIAVAVPFVLTLFFRRAGIFNQLDRVGEAISPIDDSLSGPIAPEEVVNEVVTVYAPLVGDMAPITESKDPVFSQGTMGQGVVIEPSEGHVYTPMNGTISLVFPSKHAIGITDDHGIDMLIHVGLDTVNLNGQYFETHVKQGDRVTVGDLLLDFDIEGIKESGFLTQTQIVITNSDSYQVDPIIKEGQVNKNTSILQVKSI